MVSRPEEQEMAVQAVEAEADMVQAVNEPIERLQVCWTILILCRAHAACVVDTSVTLDMHRTCMSVHSSHTCM